MLTLKILFALSTLHYVTSRPGYTSLSNAILSSMTNLWNEEHIGTISGNPVPNTDLWHYLEPGNYSVTNDGHKEKLQIYQPMTQTLNPSHYHRGPKKANENIYLKHKRRGKGFRVENDSKQPKSVHFVGTARDNESPLYNAVYDSRPLSYDRLLHHYDYLDEYQAYTREEPNCSKSDSIESLLSKFLETIKVIVKRPIEVNANVAGCDTPIVGAPRHIAQQATTELPKAYSNLETTTESSTIPNLLQTSRAPPSYVGDVPSHSRYAEKQEDIIENLKERYDKLYRLVEMIGRSKDEIKENTETKPVTDSTDSISSELSSENSTYLQTDTTDKPTNVAETIPTEQSVSRRFEDTTPNIATETAAKEEAEADDSIRDTSDNNITKDAEEIDETTTLNGVFLADNTKKQPIIQNVLIDTIPFSRRRRRSIDRGFSKRSATTAVNMEDAPYESFVQDTLGNKTALLDTLVLNANPIVEHIHDHLLKYEKITQGEWKPPRKEINCTDSIVTKEPPVNVEELVSNPPEFIVKI